MKINGIQGLSRSYQKIYSLLFLQMIAINVYTYNKYLELLVRINSDVRFQATFATAAKKLRVW